MSKAEDLNIARNKIVHSVWAVTPHTEDPIITRMKNRLAGNANKLELVAENVEIEDIEQASLGYAENGVCSRYSYALLLGEVVTSRSV